MSQLLAPTRKSYTDLCSYIMKLLVTLPSVALVVLASSAFAQGITGTFVTAPNDEGNTGHVQFAKCGEAFCGTLVASFDSTGKPLASDSIGKDIVWDMIDQGNGRFKGGKIWDPGADKTYRSKMALEGDTLNVSGCVGPICRKKIWTRLK